MKTRKAFALFAFVFALVIAGCGVSPKPIESVDKAPQGQQEQPEPTSGGEPKEAPAKQSEHAGVPVALRVEGAQLVNDQGDPIQLKGISTHGLSWFPQYVNADLFGELANDWGANAVRLALYTAESGGYCTDGNKDELRQLVLDGVQYATEANMYVIVDWHILSDNNPLEHADEAEVFFKDMSSALADNNNVLYEICNEPNGSTSWADVKEYAERIIPQIRANNPDSIIIVGTPEWSQRVDQAAADPLSFDNVLYALHFYAATHKDDLRNRMTNAIGSGLPVFVSEFGICDASGNGDIDEESAATWIREMDKQGVSYLMWNLSNKNESSSVISSDCGKSSGFSNDDLSFAGKWLKAVLLGDAGQMPEPEQPAQYQSGEFSYTMKKKTSWPVGDR